MVEALIAKEYREKFTDDQFEAIFEAIDQYHNGADLDVPHIRRVLQVSGWVIVDVDTFLLYQFPRVTYSITVAIKI